MIDAADEPVELVRGLTRRAAVGGVVLLLLPALGVAVGSAAATVAAGLAAVASVLWCRPLLAVLFQTLAHRAAAEHALRASEARYRDLFAHAVEGIFQTSPDGRYLIANSALARIYGYESADALIQSVSEIASQIYVDPRRRDEFAARLQTADVVVDFESEVRRRDGSTIWIVENARACRDGDGRVLYYEGNVQEVTDRRRAQDELERHRADLEHLVEERTREISALNLAYRREITKRQQAEKSVWESRNRLAQNEEYLRALVDGASDMVTLLDAQRRLMFASPSFERTLGRPVQSVLGQDVAELIHPDDRERMEAYWTDVLRRPGPSAQVTYRARHADGSWRLLEAVGNNQCANPAVHGLIFNTRDITEREQVKAALHVRDRAIAATTEGITISDPRQPDHPLVYVNSGFERMTGYRSDEVVGRNCRFLQGADTEPATVSEVRRCIAEERPCTVELLNYRKDGTPFWNLLSITPIRDDAGVVTNFIGVQVDITHRKEIERLKTELVATVSHELRTPLASLRGFAELMLNRDYPDDRRRHFLGIIHDEALRLTRLINEFLDLQRLEAGREVHRRELFEIGPLLHDASLLYATANAGCRIEVAVPAALPPLRGDVDRIRQVLGNLLSNAIKFSPDGGAVELGARHDGDQMVLWVRDHGLGMSPENLERLFTKFFRVDNAATRQIGGTGLGLALVKQIVEAHGGRVWVESELGRGSTFFVALPIAHAQQAA